MNLDRQSLFEEHKKLVASVVGLYVDTPQEREDLQQEVWLEVFRSLDSFQGRSKISTWIFALASNQVKTWLSRSRRTPAIPPAPRRPPSTARPLEEAVLRKDSLRSALEGISREEQEVVTMRYSLGLSYEELAKALGLPLTTVKARLFSARRKMRDILSI